MVVETSVPDRGELLYAVSYSLLGLCVICVALRMWVRIRILRSCGWDDAFIILAIICATINTALVTVSIVYGTGRHEQDLSRTQRTTAMKFQLLSQGFHVMSTNWGKVSVAVFLVRIISEVKHHKHAMYGGMIALTTVNVLGVYTIYGQCTPTARIWDADLPGSCWPHNAQRNYAFFQGSASALSDLVLAVYPLFTIWNLQMATKVKIGVGFVLSLGIIAMVAAIIKTIHLAALSIRADYTWDMVSLTIWVAVEQYLIILAACIPALTPLFNIVVRQRSSKQNTASDPHRLKGSNSQKLSHPKPYTPFASVGREYVEYPMTWARSDTAHLDSGSDKEGLIVTSVEGNQGILRTTEFHVHGLSQRRD